MGDPDLPQPRRQDPLAQSGLLPHRHRLHRGRQVDLRRRAVGELGVEVRMMGETLMPYRILLLCSFAALALSACTAAAASPGDAAIEGEYIVVLKDSVGHPGA